MRILIVQDNETQARSARSSLERHGLDVECLGTLSQALNRLHEPGVDAILLDLSLPDSCGIETFHAVKACTDGIPIVIFTGQEDQQVSLLALKEGAQDFLIDGQEREDTIVRCLRYAIERSNVDAALRTSERRLRIILENSHDAFISADASWRIKDWNSQAEELFGKVADEVLGEPLFIVMPQHLRRRYIRQIETFFKRNQHNIAHMIDEMVAVHKDGIEFPIEIALFRISEDVNYSYCAFIQDISRRKQTADEMERQIQERTAELTESNKELAQFAKIAAHDLQEPLRAIQGFSKLLAENISQGQLDKPENKEFMEYVIDGADRMQQLMQSILVHSNIKRESQETISTDCNSIIEEVLANLRASIHETSAQIEVNDLPAVAVERWQLLQLFQNLISNSMKYRSQETPKIYVSAEPSVDRWLFSVRDNGIGIDARYGERIFDMFSRLHGEDEYSGTGMGLAICRKIVTAHGGTIWLESEPEHGSAFFFTLPGAGEISRREDMDKNAIEILLVEDSRSDVRLTQEALRRSDLAYKLDVASDGVKAMDYLNGRKDSHEKLPDIILLDLNMPRKNGHEVLAEIKADPELKKIPVVLLTVSRREQDVMEALSLGMNYYLAKPIESQLLSALINSIVDLESEPALERHERTGEEAHIRLVLAGNPHTPIPILSKLSVDGDARVRARVAENPGVSEELLNQLAQDGNAEVRSSVAENPRASEVILERIAADDSDDVRLSVASNPRIPFHILSLLKNDENVFVASAANETLSKLAS